MFRLFITISVLLLVCNTHTSGSYDDLYKPFENRLLRYLTQAKEATTPVKQNEYAEQALKLFDTLLSDYESFHYPLHALPVEQVFSHDSSLRIIGWNYMQQDGSHTYYGVVQVYDTSRHYYNHWLLSPRGQLDSGIMSDTNWYGALYYDIIPVAYKGKLFYTLLGVDFHNVMTTKRIIDLLQIDYNTNRLQFGDTRFFYRKAWHKRIIFEYSARVSMTLQYSEKEQLIIYDNLEPTQAKYKGHYEFYGPDLTFNALQLRFGKWDEIENIQVTPETFR